VRFVLGNEQLFLNSTSDVSLLPFVLDAAAGEPTPPGDDELRTDADTHSITALFDGADLERI
jgi:hypothetical protein